VGVSYDWVPGPYVNRTTVSPGLKTDFRSHGIAARAHVLSHALSFDPLGDPSDGEGTQAVGRLPAQGD
jgi:hypothetical protein